jgi:hypothetical protein
MNIAKKLKINLVLMGVAEAVTGLRVFFTGFFREVKKFAHFNYESRVQYYTELVQDSTL